MRAASILAGAGMSNSSCRCACIHCGAIYLGAIEAEEGGGPVGQEELQGGRLQQEARVVQLAQRPQRPPLVRPPRPRQAACNPEF